MTKKVRGKFGLPRCWVPSTCVHRRGDIFMSCSRCLCPTCGFARCFEFDAFCVSQLTCCLSSFDILVRINAFTHSGSLFPNWPVWSRTVTGEHVWSVERRKTQMGTRRPPGGADSGEASRVVRGREEARGRGSGPTSQASSTCAVAFSLKTFRKRQ